MSVVRNCHHHLMVTFTPPTFYSSAGGSQVGPQISSRENSLQVPLSPVSPVFHSRSKTIHIISEWIKLSYSYQSIVTEYLGNLYAIEICFPQFWMGRRWTGEEGKHDEEQVHTFPQCVFGVFIGWYAKSRGMQQGRRLWGSIKIETEALLLWWTLGSHWNNVSNDYKPVIQAVI